mmetsp:Transcript_24858/g.78323  ORF Transcript_24858/g.78323 Transcript_24858/m.78323 type:complete len:224 (+) Transcript_24858:770-1441(+)
MKVTELLSISSCVLTVCGRAAAKPSPDGRKSKTKSRGRRRCRMASALVPLATALFTPASSSLPLWAAASRSALAEALSAAVSASCTSLGQGRPACNFRSASSSPFRRNFSFSAFSSRRRSGFSVLRLPFGSSPFAATAAMAMPRPPASAHALEGLSKGQWSHARPPMPAVPRAAPTAPSPARWAFVSFCSPCPGTSASRAARGDSRDCSESLSSFAPCSPCAS